MAYGKCESEIFVPPSAAGQTGLEIAQRHKLNLIVLDPILSLRQRIRVAPGATVRLSCATGVAGDRDAAYALAQKYRDPSATLRAFALALGQAQSALHHLAISSDDALLFG